MTDRELWVKTCKTVGAMTGGTVLLLGSMSLLVMLIAGHPTPASSDAPGASTAADTGKTEAVPPPGARTPRRGVVANGRPGESI